MPYREKKASPAKARSIHHSATREPISTVPRNKRACVVCRELIPVGARKCTHCNSYQDWTNYLTTWSAILAAPIALLPLTSIAISLWKLTSVANFGKIEMELVSCDRSKIKAAYVNSGTRPALVVGHSFALIKSGREQIVSYKTSDRHRHYQGNKSE